MSEPNAPWYKTRLFTSGEVMRLQRLVEALRKETQFEQPDGSANDPTTRAARALQKARAELQSALDVYLGTP